MSNIDRAFQNMPKLMSINNYMQDPYNNTMQFQQTMPQQMTYGSQGGQNYPMAQPFQFQHSLQQQYYQQQQMQYQHMMFQTQQFPNSFQQTLKLNQNAYQTGRQQPKFMQTDPLASTKDRAQLNGTENPELQNKQSINIVGDDQFKKIIPDSLQRNQQKLKKKSSSNNQVKIQEGAKVFLLEQSFDEKDYQSELPRSLKQPEECAIDLYKQNKRQTEELKEREDKKQSEAIYRLEGRKQNEVNELLFNGEELKKQKQKTQDTMMNALNHQLDKLLKEADRYEHELVDNQHELNQMEKDTTDYNDILDRIRTQRQAERVLLKIDKAMEIKEKDIEDEKAAELYRDMTTAEINEKLENMYVQNQDLYGKVSELVKDIQNDQFYGRCVDNESQLYESSLIDSEDRNKFQDVNQNQRKLSVKMNKDYNTQDILDDGEEEEFEISNYNGNKEDEEFDNIVGCLQEIVLDEKFEQIQRDFFKKYYKIFENTEENKMEYMTIFKDYQKQIEKHIDSELQARIEEFNMKDFLEILPDRSEEIDDQLMDLLYSFADFQAFKELVLDYKTEFEELEKIERLKTIKQTAKKTLNKASNQMQQQQSKNIFADNNRQANLFSNNKNPIQA